MTEVWKPISGYEGLYEVSNLGRVKALDRYIENNGGMQHRRERILKPHGSPHLGVTLCKGGTTKRLTVHRLVAKAFVPNPNDKPVVDHIDTNPQNNNADNLRWVTTQENTMNPLTRFHNSQSKMGHKWNVGHRHSEESKRKISESKKGKKLSEETKRKLSESHMGHRHAAESIAKMSESRKGHEVSAETRRKIGEKIKGVHKGKHWKVENGKRVWY